MVFYNYWRPKGQVVLKLLTTKSRAKHAHVCVTKEMMMRRMKMRIVGGRPRAGPGVHVRRILSDPTSEQLRVPELRGREGETCTSLWRGKPVLDDELEFGRLLAFNAS